MVGILQAFPHTALWHRLDQEGRLIKAADEFDQGVQTHLLNFRPTRPMAEIAQEFLAAFRLLYDPHRYMRRVYRYSRKLAEGRQHSRGQRNQPRSWTQGSGLVRGLLTLIWRQGLRRDTRWLFWRQLAAMAWRYPGGLDNYLWLLMLNEHFIDYQQLVQDQIEAQLRSSQFLGVDQPQPAALIAATRQLTPAP